MREREKETGGFVAEITFRHPLKSVMGKVSLGEGTERCLLEYTTRYLLYRLYLVL